MTAEKPKSKHPLAVIRRFQICLFIWIIVTHLAAMYPLIWLVPPYHHLTPYIYIGASLLWIPFTVRHIRRFGLRWLTILLMSGCVLGMIVQAKVWQWRSPARETILIEQTAAPGITTYILDQGCTGLRFVLIGIERLPVALMTETGGGIGYVCAMF